MLWVFEGFRLFRFWARVWYDFSSLKPARNHVDSSLYRTFPRVPRKQLSVGNINMAIYYTGSIEGLHSRFPTYNQQVNLVARFQFAVIISWLVAGHSVEGCNFPTAKIHMSYSLTE